jgi:RNA polymerase sporulation-specific sigma factor
MFLTDANSLMYNCYVNTIFYKTEEGRLVKMNTQIHSNLDLENEKEENIVEYAKQGDARSQEFLISKYKNFVRAKSRTYFLIGADREDIIQEGMIGLFKAMRDYNPDKANSFKSFAEMCITRQIITAIKTATRQKHIPLNSYISLSKPVYDGDSERSLIDIMSGRTVLDPEQLVISQEEVGNIQKKMCEVLSDLEQQVLNYYMQGESYQEIAIELNRHIKSIDNALQRVKRKLENFLEQEK